MPARHRVARRLAFVPALRVGAWALLALAVFFTVPGPQDLLAGMVAEGRLPRWILLLPILLFGAFVIAFAVYRLALVRAGRYHPGKALLQIATGILVLALVAPMNLERHRVAAAASRGERVPLGPLLSSPDARIRAVACEALAARGKAAEPLRAEAGRLAADDPDPRVRQACARVR